MKQKNRKKKPVVTQTLKEKTTFDVKPYLGLILFVFTVILYANTLSNGYNLDDELVTRHHPLTSQGLKAIPEIITTPYYSKGKDAYEYRPMVLFSFALEHQLLGESPFWSHLINILLYALSILVLFGLLKRILFEYPVWLSFLVAFIFAIHPLHTEVVCSIKNRDEILAFLFGVLAWFWAQKYVLKGRPVFLILVVIAFVAALFSKAGILTFAFIIPVSFIIFDRSSMMRIFVITLVLSIISAFQAPFYNFAHKIFFGMAVLAAPFATHIVLHARESILTYFKNIFKGTSHINPAFNISLFQVILVILAALSVSVAGMFYNYRILIFVPMGGLILMYYAVDIKWRAFLMTTLVLIAALVSVNYEQAHVLAFALILVLYNVLYEEHKIKPYHVVALLIIAIPWVLWSKLEGLFWMGYLAFIMYAFSVKKLRMWAVGLIVVFFISSPIVSYLRHTGIFTNAHLYSFIVLSITLFIYSRLRRPSMALLLLLVAVPLSSGIKLAGMTGSYSVVIEEYFNPATAIQIGTDILPASGRPLDMVEMPLTVHDPLALKAGTGLYVMLNYLKMMVFPLNLGFYYGYRFIEPQMWYRVWPLLSALLFGLLLGLSLFYYRKEKLYLFALLTFLAAVSLYSNIVMSLPGLMADRFAYVPSLGFALIVGFVIWKLLNGNASLRKAGIVLLILIGVFFSVRTFMRNSQWKDPLTLFRADIDYLDKSAQAHNLLATHLMMASEKEKNISTVEVLRKEAIVHYQKALDVYPDFFNVQYDLGRAFYSLHILDSAEVHFEKAIDLQPDFFDPYLQIAFINHQKDSLNKALEYYQKAIDIKKEIPAAYNNMSTIYFTLNDMPKLLEVNEKFAILYPDQKTPYINIARAYYLNAAYSEAAVYFEKVTTFDPSDVDAVRALIEIYGILGNEERQLYFKNLFDSRYR